MRKMSTDLRTERAKEFELNNIVSNYFRFYVSEYFILEAWIWYHSFTGVKYYQRGHIYIYVSLLVK